MYLQDALYPFQNLQISSLVMKILQVTDALSWARQTKCEETVYFLAAGLLTERPRFVNNHFVEILEIFERNEIKRGRGRKSRTFPLCFSSFTELKFGSRNHFSFGNWTYFQIFFLPCSPFFCFFT